MSGCPFLKSLLLTISASFLLSPYGCDHLLIISGTVGKWINFQVVRVWLLLERYLVVRCAVFWIEFRHRRDEVDRVLHPIILLIHLSDIVRARTERCLPVLLVHVVVIIWVHWAGARSGVTIPERCADITWDTVPIVTADTPFHGESFPPVFPDEPSFLQNFFNHLWGKLLDY